MLSIRQYLLLLFLLLITGEISAKKIHYLVDLRNSGSGRIHVTLELEMMGAEVVNFQMPAWAPGAYAMTNYGRFVENFKAFGHDGKQKPIERINENRWHIKHGKDIKRITYEVINSYKDSTSLYFALAHFDSALVFANSPALFGYVNNEKQLPAEVTYKYPKNWQLEVVLDSLGTSETQDHRETRYRAKNYDELIDAPLMAGTGFQNRSFMLGKTRFDIVVTSDREFPMDSLTYYTKQIVEAQLDFFRDTPFVNYKFLINAPTFLNMPRKDNGALEHANSSAYLLVNVPWAYVRDPFCHIISHEFFHAWNVKRIHSNKLGPFDYTKPVRTTELWMAEGVTDYFAHFLLSRYNILPPESVASTISALSEAIENDNEPYMLSLEELSLEESNFNIENALQFYTRGTLSGLLLDIELRSRTNNKQSLDNVILTLNKEAKQRKTYSDSQLADKITKITGVNIKDFYKKYIAGKTAYPIDEYLKKVGVARRIRLTESTGVSLRTKFDSSGGILVIDSIFETSAFHKSSIVSGDTLLMIGGVIATSPALAEWTTSREVPVTETFTFGTPRGRIKKTFTLTQPKESYTRELEAGVLPETTADQDELRQAIFGTHFNFIGWKDNFTIRSYETNVEESKK